MMNSTDVSPADGGGVPVALRPRRSTLGEILVRCGILTEANLRRGLEAQKATGKRLGEALIDLGLVRRDDIEWALSSQFQIPMVRIQDLRIERACAALVPEGLARQYRLAPLFIAGGELSVVVDDPVKIDAIEDIEQITGLKVNVSLSSASEVTALLDDLYGSAPPQAAAEPGAPREAGVTSAAHPGARLQPFLADITGKSFFKFVLEDALREGASGVLLKAEGGLRTVHYRVGGLLRERFRLRDDWYRILFARLTLLAGRENVAAEETLDAPVTVDVDGRSVTFGLTVFPGIEGPSACLHATAWEAPVPSLLEMEMPPEKKVLLPFFLRRRGGLWISTGPGPDGGLVLHALLRALPQDGRRAVSFRQDSRELNLGADYVGLQRLRSNGTEKDLEFAIRNGFDIVLVDATHEREDLTRVFLAALSGRTVLTNSSIGDPESLIRYFLAAGIPAPLVTSGLSAILRHGTVRLLCPSCRQIDATAEPADLRALDLPLGNGPFFRTRGCERCGFAGFERKDVLLDFVPMAGPLKRSLLRGGANPDLGRVNGDLSARASELARAGRIGIDDVLPFLEI